MSGRLTAALYRTAWRCTRYLPTWLGYGLAHAGADVAWTVHRLRPTRTGVGQLERNLARLLPADAGPAPSTAPPGPPCAPTCATSTRPSPCPP